MCLASMISYGRGFYIFKGACAILVLVEPSRGTLHFRKIRGCTCCCVRSYLSLGRLSLAVLLRVYFCLLPQSKNISNIDRRHHALPRSSGRLRKGLLRCTPAWPAPYRESHTSPWPAPALSLWSSCWNKSSSMKYSVPSGAAASFQIASTPGSAHCFQIADSAVRQSTGAKPSSVWTGAGT